MNFCGLPFYPVALPVCLLPESPFDVNTTLVGARIRGSADLVALRELAQLFRRLAQRRFQFADQACIDGVLNHWHAAAIRAFGCPHCDGHKAGVAAWSPADGWIERTGIADLESRWVMSCSCMMRQSRLPISALMTLAVMVAKISAILSQIAAIFSKREETHET